MTADGTGFSAERGFSDSVAAIYEELLVPLLFAPYADDLVARIAARPPARLLELAAGTGVVTRRLAAALPAGAGIVATDLNQSMLDQATAIGAGGRPVQWRRADMLDLPFPDGAFDAVVCQFGLMFPPDKAAAFAEARRVLEPGGTLYFNVWDRVEDNEFADVVTEAVAGLFPDDPPRFLARIPHGYHDVEAIERDVRAGGFEAAPEVETVTFRSRAADARTVAVACCQGSPLRTEIEARDASRLGEATDTAAAALAERFGTGPVDGKMQAFVVTVER